MSYNILTTTDNLSHEEWLEWRKQGIGGSDASIICSLNKYKSALELWMEKKGLTESKQAGENAYWGNVLESVVRDEFTKRTGLEVKQEKAILQHCEHLFMLANVDGIIDDPIHGKCIFEAKTASVYLKDDWENNIPENYQLQVQHYLAVTGFSAAYIAVLIGGNTFKWQFIKRDDTIIDLLIKHEKIFWDMITNDVPPQIDGSEACTELLNHLYPNSKGKSIELPISLIELMDKYNDLQDQEKDVELQKNEVSNKIKDILQDNESGYVGDYSVSWKSVNTERLDTKKLKLESPDTYEKYSYKSSSRRFSIKKMLNRQLLKNIILIELEVLQ